MKNSQNTHTISSTLKVIASESLSIEDEIVNAKDKPLEEILNEKKEKNISQNSE